MTPKILEQKAADIMTKNPKTMTADVLAVDAVNFMNTNKVTNLFIVDGKKPIGFLHIHDCLRAGIA